MLFKKNVKFFNAMHFTKTKSLVYLFLNKNLNKNNFFKKLLILQNHRFSLIPTIDLKKANKRVLIKFKYKIIEPTNIKKSNFFFFLSCL